MSVTTDVILSSTLSLGQDVSWQGETVFTDFCLYTDESSESSRMVKVDFQLEGIIDYAAIKLFMFQRNRYKAGLVDSNSSMFSFLSGLFEQGTNISNTTKRALMISVSSIKEDLQQFQIGSKCIIYGEHDFIFVHPIYNDQMFLPIYEQSTFLPDHDTTRLEPILDELFGKEYECLHNITSSAQLITPDNKKNELELIRDMNYNGVDRDVLSEFKERKKEQQQQKLTRKSKPNKLVVNKTTLLEEKKLVVKKLIKEALSGTAKEDKSINQLIYSSIRYTYRHVLTSSKPLDESKLKCIIKLHADFYNNLDTIVNLFHSGNE